MKRTIRPCDVLLYTSFNYASYLKGILIGNVSHSQQGKFQIRLSKVDETETF